MSTITMTTTTTTDTITQPLKLYTADGPIIRQISAKPSRQCTTEEIPVIDVGRLWGDLDERKSLAREILWACENAGFFYMKNHRVPRTMIDRTLDKARQCVTLPQVSCDETAV